MTSISGPTNMTIGELMDKLKEPLPAIGGYMEFIWDADEPSLMDLTDILGDDQEFVVEKQRLSEEITNTITNIIKRQSRQSRGVSKTDSYDLDMMTVEEILDKLKCKCTNFQSKFAKKAEIKFSFTDSGKGSKSTKSREVSSKFTLPKIGANCKDFLNVKDYAISFIDDLLQEAEEKVNYEPYPSTYSLDTSDVRVLYYGEGYELVVPASRELQVTEVPSGLVSWLSYLLIEDFTPKSGRELINDIIHNTWNLKKAWSYCIDFLAENSNTCADFYIYQVKWSLPTMNYPIPQVTASVYFTIEVSRVKPKDCPVNLTYQFETERYKFTIDDDIQQELFLDNILKCKLDFFKSRRM